MTKVVNELKAKLHQHQQQKSKKDEEIDPVLLQEVKLEYQVQQSQSAEEFDQLVASQIDSISSVSRLLDNSETDISSNFHQLLTQTNDGAIFPKFPKIQRLNVCRENLHDCLQQIALYATIPQTIKQLLEFTTPLPEIYRQWISLNQWKEHIVTQVQQITDCSGSDVHDKKRNSPTSKMQSSLLQAFETRFKDIKDLETKIRDKMWYCVENCVNMVQLNQSLLEEVFTTVDMMKKYHDLNKIKDDYISTMDEFKNTVEGGARKRAKVAFDNLEEENEDDTANSIFDKTLSGGNALLIDLGVLYEEEKSNVLPQKFNILGIYATVFNIAIEEKLSVLCSQSDTNVAQKLQLVQWIDYYNTEIEKYGSYIQKSEILTEASKMLMTIYLDETQSQIRQWIRNIWSRQEKNLSNESNTGDRKDSFFLQKVPTATLVAATQELHSDLPSDILQILTSQLIIAKEWLIETRLEQVTLACVNLLNNILNEHFVSIKQNYISKEIEVEDLCCLINDIYTLQTEITSFLVKLEVITEDGMDTDEENSIEKSINSLLNIAGDVCHLVVERILTEVEDSVLVMWFSKEWESNLESDIPPYVENLCLTFEDYFQDIQLWLQPDCLMYFFKKILKFTIERCIKEYVDRFFEKMPLSDHIVTSELVVKDFYSFVGYFEKYLSSLRLYGIRKVEDLEKEFSRLLDLKNFIIDCKSGMSSKNTFGERGEDLILYINKTKKDQKPILNSPTTNSNPFKKPFATLNPFSPKKPANPFEKTNNEVRDSTSSINELSLDDFLAK